jgi:hypothetical protein
MLELKADRLDCAGYEQDMVLWFEHQIALLRQRRFVELDLDNLIEELESIVKRERRKLGNRLEVLLMHLLTCEFQPERLSKSWLRTLYEQRRRIEQILRDSPSLGPSLDEVVEEAYPHAVQLAAIETKLPSTACPAKNPYSLEQLRNKDFVPANSARAAPPSP